MKTRIISILLAVCLIFGLLPVGVLAASATSGSCGKNATWSYNAATKTLSISGSGDMTDYETDPAMGIENAPPWDDYREEIEHVIINEGITSIGAEAFGFQYTSNCYSNLSSVSIALTVTKIGSCAFTNAEKLKSIDLPNVTSIGYAAFNGTGIQSLMLPSTLETFEYEDSRGFLSCGNLQSITVDPGNQKYRSVDGVLFAGNKLLRYPAGKAGNIYTVPSGTTWIATSAFADNENITTISIPSSVSKIDSLAFEQCSKLAKITIAEGVTRVASDAFWGTALTSIVLPASVNDFTTNWGTEPDVDYLNRTFYFTGTEAPEFDTYCCNVWSGYKVVICYPENATGWDAVRQQDNVKYQVEAGVLEFVFGEIADDVTSIDTDGDGLLDSWEINGLDIDGDGIIDVPLNKMGADPNVPDIFVEVDWMVQPERKILCFTTQKRISLAPSESAMRIVYNSFKKHGINIHIDAGPDSIDFVTGKKWGSLSGGNEVSYEKDFSLGSNLSHWSNVAKNNFTKERATTFRHCIFINQYDGGTSSGIANNIPGQFFLVANQDWVRDTGDIGVAGTFMHELGHTLGLSHGGFDHAGNNNHENYKPNYLSIMNYLFQTSGLAGTRDVNYSDYTLPDIDEYALYEPNGIDPNMVTAGSGIGTKLLSSGRTFAPIAGMGIDFDGQRGIEGKTVSVDLNGNKMKSVLTGTRDWGNIIYKGGNIGFSEQIIHIEGITQPDATQKHELSELTYEEALGNGILGYVGSGALEDIGPYTLLSGHDGQSVYVRVKNLANEPVDFTVSISASPLNSASVMNISLDASTESISYTEIPIAILNSDIPGSYTISVTLLYKNTEIARIDVPVEISNIPQENLKKLLDDETIQLPNTVRNEYEKILGEEHSVFSHWSNDKLSHWHDCSCGNKHDKAEHTVSEWIIDLRATSNTAGSRHKECTICGYVIATETISATGSNFNYSGIVAGRNDVPFTDVSKTDYFYEAILWAVENGITTGTSRTRFSPYATCTRAQAVTFLWRSSGSPAPKNSRMPFTDVSPSAYYYDAVLWALEEGITTGTASTTFSPDAVIDRAQAVTLLHRANGAPSVTGRIVFTDVPQTTYYADAVKWAVDHEITTGTSAAAFSPNASCTRAQIVTFLYRAYRG